MEVFIRPLIEQDAYTSVKWRNDSEVFKYTGNTYDHEITIESEISWIKRVISNTKDYRCAIIVDGVYVGNIYLTDIENRTAQYHIFIGEKSFWGKGIAKQASLLIIKHGFEKLGLSRIMLRVRRENLSALALYKSLGFEATDETDMLTMSLQRESFHPYLL